MDLVRESLDGTDFGIAVIPPVSDNDSGVRAAIFIEIGIIAARNIPILAVVDPSEPPISALGGIVTVKSSTGESDALEWHIDLFLRRLSMQKSNSELWSYYNLLRAERAISGSPAVREAVERKPRAVQWYDIGHRGRSGEARIAEYLDELLTAQGALVQREPRNVDLRVDIAFTHPELRETVLIELKNYHTGESSLGRARNQLSAYLRNSSQAIGLLLYAGPHHTSESNISPDSPRVWAMTVDEFLEEIDGQHLADFLTRIRNRMVHVGE
ncbi:hypothetical protein [Nocardia asiatica]|uniref:hypothetical protein n=1 Tax=Nocardia asiatica TaxID=209252 RepID=UPI0024589024|nr:hypothetical protein [Nocardia asiatica]